MLAEKKDPRLVIRADINNAAFKYKLTLQKCFRQEFRDIYAKYLKHFLRDKMLSDEEIEKLSHLKGLFWINDREAGEIHEQVAEAVYERAVRKAVQDGRLTDEEKTFLNKIQNELRIPPETAKSILEESSEKIFNAFLYGAISDDRLSPDEEAELKAIKKSLGVNSHIDEVTRYSLEKSRIMWQIENGKMPSIKPDISLKSKEICHYWIKAFWFEAKKVFVKTDYGKEPMLETIPVFVDPIHVYVTNKRIILMGIEKTTSINFTKVIAVRDYDDGVQIQKDSGKSPILVLDDGDTEVFAAIAQKAMLNAK
jgi:hypothetical protein